MIANLWHRLMDFLYRELWQADLSAMERGRAFAYQSLRLAMVLFRELTGGVLALYATSLVYTTLLSMVPLLAVIFSVLKAFNVHNQMEPLLLNFLEPLGEKGEEITHRILQFIDNINVGVLGWVGMVFLIYTVISLIRKIEEAFNFVWHVTSSRSFSRAFADYLSVILVGPVLVFSALGMTATVMSAPVVQRIIAIEPFGTAVLLAGRLVPYFIIIGAFTFIYIFVPNIRVNWRSALVGGVVGGILWQTLGWTFASFAAGSTRYDAIYSSLAILILFMIWLYLSWFVLLFGSKIAYYHQHPEQIRLGSDQAPLSARLVERLGLLIMYLVTESYVHGRQPWSADALVHRLRFPGDAVADVIEILIRKGLLAENSGEPAGYLPARDPDSITVEELLRQLRSAHEEGYTVDEAALSLKVVDQALATVERERHRSLGGVTLKQLVLK